MKKVKQTDENLKRKKFFKLMRGDHKRKNGALKSTYMCACVLKEL